MLNVYYRTYPEKGTKLELWRYSVETDDLKTAQQSILEMFHEADLAHVPPLLVVLKGGKQ